MRASSHCATATLSRWRTLTGNWPADCTTLVPRGLEGGSPQIETKQPAARRFQLGIKPGVSVSVTDSVWVLAGGVGGCIVGTCVQERCPIAQACAGGPGEAGVVRALYYRLRVLAQETETKRRQADRSTGVLESSRFLKFNGPFNAGSFPLLQVCSTRRASAAGSAADFRPTDQRVDPQSRATNLTHKASTNDVRAHRPLVACRPHVHKHGLHGNEVANRPATHSCRQVGLPRNCTMGAAGCVKEAVRPGPRPRGQGRTSGLPHGVVASAAHACIGCRRARHNR